MTVAADIKRVFTGNYESLVKVCESKAVDVDQDWDNETTTYFFEDSSLIVCSGPDVQAVNIIDGMSFDATTGARLD